MFHVSLHVSLTGLQPESGERCNFQEQGVKETKHIISWPVFKACVSHLSQWFCSHLPIPALQKLNQLDMEAHFILHDVCCLWIWLRAKMEVTFTGEILKKHDELFMSGYLELIITFLSGKSHWKWIWDDWSPKIFGWDGEEIMGFPETPSQILSQKFLAGPKKSITFCLGFFCLEFHGVSGNPVTISIVSGESIIFWDLSWTKKNDWTLQNLGFCDGVSRNPVTFWSQNLAPEFDWFFSDILFFLIFLFFSMHLRTRHLDTDLSTVMRAAEDFDWKRINFVLEALWLKLRSYAFFGLPQSWTDQIINTMFWILHVV